ncbi:MAG: NADH-quinone oxidoreductase subunit NuoG [Anaerolineae bacterium]
MANYVTVTIDGQEIKVPAGTLIVEAARLIGNEIPVFCYHPRLEPVGMCRMCLVEVGTPRMDPATRQPVLDDNGKPVIAMMPKPQTACTMPVSPGMVVKTTTPAVADARRSVLEFLLTSHPLDCPICDKGGECPLQELTFRYGPGVSRMPLDAKFTFFKPIPLGDLIMLDRERCVQCARCIRFQDEIADDHVLEFKNRGRGMEIITVSTPPFDSKWSGNTTDICPVGALTSRDFRFGGRPWELNNTPSICPHCSVGCNIVIAERYDDIKRVMPLENNDVNDIWICDKGRFGHHFVNARERLTQPLVRRGDALQPATWDEALSVVAERLSTIRATNGPDAIGGLAGDRVPNEDLYLFQKLMRGVIGTNNVDHPTRLAFAPNAADLVAQVGTGSGSNLELMGKGDAILVIGADPDEEQPVLWLRIKQTAHKRGASLIVANARPTKLDRYTRQALRYRLGVADHVALGLVAALLERGELDAAVADDLRQAAGDYALATAVDMTGIAADTFKAAVETLAKAPDAVIFFGSELSAAGVQALANLAILTQHVGRPNNGLVALLPHNNSQGALDMGVQPARLPGYVPVDGDTSAFASVWDAPIPTQPGLHAGQMLQPQAVRALYVMAADPLSENPESAAALADLEFLVVQELFLTETAARAHVVLPAASWAERDGTFTTTDRRVQKFAPAIRKLGQTRLDWEIIAEIAQRVRATDDRHERGDGRRSMARDWTYVTADQIKAEIAELSPMHAGAEAADEGMATLRGRPPFEGFVQTGTSFKFQAENDYQWPTAADGGNAPSPHWIASDSQPIEAPAGQLLLAPVRLLFDHGTLIGKSPLLARRTPGPFVAVNPADAVRLGIPMDAAVEVATTAGKGEFTARITAMAPEGMLLVAEDMGAPVRGTLLAPDGRPEPARLQVVRELVAGD